MACTNSLNFDKNRNTLVTIVFRKSLDDAERLGNRIYITEIFLPVDVFVILRRAASGKEVLSFLVVST